MIKLSLLRQHKELVLLLIVSAITHIMWFSFGTFSFGDTFYEFPQQISEYVGAFEHSTWLASQDLGSPNIEPYFYPFYFIRGIFSYFHAYYNVSVVVVFFLPIIFVAPIGLYVLARRLDIQKRFAAIAAALYSFNTYYIVLQTQHLTLSVAYAIAPLTLVICWYALDRYDQRNENKRYILYACFAVCFQIIAEPRIFFILLPLLFAILLKHKMTLKKKVHFVAPFIFISILISMFWILAIGFASTDQVSATASRGLFGNNYKSLSTALTLMHGSWNGAEPVTFSLQPVPYYFWLVPITIGLGFLFIDRKQRRTANLLLVLALIGVFLVKMSNPPLAASYQWLFDHVPGFQLFRESSKFYLLIAISYALLMGISLQAIVKRLERRKATKLIKMIPILLILFVFLMNIFPMLTNSINGMFTQRNIPTSYKAFNDKVEKDNKFYRTGWVPTVSRWAYISNIHPRTNILSLTGNVWANILSNKNTVQGTSEYKRTFLKFYDSPIAPQLVNMSAIKYIVVPQRDMANNDNFYKYYGNDRNYFVRNLDAAKWLHKISSTPGLDVYQNGGAKPYFSSSALPFRIGKVSNTDNYYNFSHSELHNNDLNFFSMNDNYNTNNPSINLNNVGEELKPSDVTREGLFFTEKLDVAKENTLYLNINDKTYGYVINNDVLRFFDKDDSSSLVNEVTMNNQPLQFLTKTILQPSKTYAFSVGTKLYDIKPTDVNRTIGKIHDPLLLYSFSKLNLLKNSSFEEKQPRGSLVDCNNYDMHPLISMSITKEKSTDGDASLRLGAKNHTACTSFTSMPIESGQTYSLQYDYQIQNSQRAGYDLIFDNPLHTVISFDQNATGGMWRKYYAKFDTPPFATHVTLRLKGYQDDNNQKYAYTYYDRVSINKLNLETKIDTTNKKVYQKIDLGHDKYLNIKTLTSNYSTNNIIDNPSFEKGLWKKTVGDCDSYDNNPQISMKLNQIYKTVGKYSLELAAKRHTACTGPENINVQESNTYLLSFDYQSSSSKYAGYYVKFNDPDGTVYTEVLNITNNKWQKFSKLITAPYGATNMTLLVYSYADISHSKVQINRYDNFSFARIPEIENKYFLVSVPNVHLAMPKQITFNSDSPSRKIIHVKNSTTPFYLNMSENYNKKWMLELADSNAAGLNAFLPWTSTNSVPDNAHYRLAGFLNSWYIDPVKLCKSRSLACKQNTDKSYDLELVAEFSPQRYFYLGLAVTSTTVVTCLGYLVYAYHTKRYYKYPVRKQHSPIKHIGSTSISKNHKH